MKTKPYNSHSRVSIMIRTTQIHWYLVLSTMLSNMLRLIGLATGRSDSFCGKMKWWCMIEVPGTSEVRAVIVEYIKEQRI
jgi:hypothetical protein